MYLCLAAAVSGLTDSVLSKPAHVYTTSSNSSSYSNYYFFPKIAFIEQDTQKASLASLLT